jgi:NAD(P)-dependent dehydrogenase (short-subunit alcohol dehydrogenase family)
MNKLKILITGGTRCLGREMAMHLIQQGHKVYIIGHINKIDPDYREVLAGFAECDLSIPDQVENAFRRILTQTGTIDVLINNAAVRKFNKMLDEFSVSEILKSIHVDFFTPVLLTNLCLPVMKRNNFGRIINISSIAASKAFAKGTLYCSSKKALITFAEALNLELKSCNGSVTMNTISPDSFSRTDGTIIKGRKWIIDSILSNIDNIIISNESGRVINVFTFKHKIRERLRYFKQALFMS